MTLAGVGGLAKIAAGLFNVSSFTAFPRIGKLPLAKNYLQGLAVGFSIQIDFALGGRLLKSVGGPVAFAGSHAIGAGVGFMPHQFGFDRHQSLAKAVVTGRLEALGAIGMAAAQAVGGTAPARGDALGEAAYGFLQSARRGDTAWSDLDAALLGAGVWEKKLESWDNLGGFALDLLNRDAGSAFSRLPSYNALNAWDMALDMQDLLEGM